MFFCNVSHSFWGYKNYRMFWENLSRHKKLIVLYGCVQSLNLSPSSSWGIHTSYKSNKGWRAECTRHTGSKINDPLSTHYRGKWRKSNKEPQYEHYGHQGWQLRGVLLWSQTFTVTTGIRTHLSTTWCLHNGNIFRTGVYRNTYWCWWDPGLQEQHKEGCSYNYSIIFSLHYSTFSKLQCHVKLKSYLWLWAWHCLNKGEILLECNMARREY